MRRSFLIIVATLCWGVTGLAQLAVGDFAVFKEAYGPVGMPTVFERGDVVRVVDIVPPGWVRVVDSLEKRDSTGLQVLSNKLIPVSEEKAVNITIANVKRKLSLVLIEANVLTAKQADEMSAEQMVDLYKAFKAAQERKQAELEALVSAQKPRGPSFIYPDGRVIVNGQCVGKAKADGWIIYNDGSYGGRIMSGGRLIDEEGNYVGQVTGGGVLPSR